MEQEHILVIDDEEGLLQLVKMRLTAMGFAVTACTSGRDAVSAAKTNRFDLAITDLRLRGEDGLDVTEELLRIHPGLPVIILTAHGSIPNAVEAVQRGAFGYLTKPFDDKELKAKIEEGLSPQRMSREIQRLKSLVNELYGMENVVARSPAMQRLLQQVIQVADSDATMLLFGETGTGKEVFAKVTHANSRRSKGPFVALNCAAIPETLFESELFGHVRGAFTSAHGPKKGLFQSAHGGTLFLDEIGEMPLSMQVKLLRAVQEREVREVGAEHATKVDVRIIAATNKDLGEAVKNGSFRNDLYYRISVVPLFIPPLQGPTRRHSHSRAVLLGEQRKTREQRRPWLYARCLASTRHKPMARQCPGARKRDRESRRDVQTGYDYAGSAALDRHGSRLTDETAHGSEGGVRKNLPQECPATDRR